MVFLWFSVFSLLDQGSTTAKGLHRNGTYNYSDTVRREALSMWYHLYHVHCALHERPTILDPNSRDVFYKTVAIEATAQHLVGNHPTSCLFPDSFLSLAILAGKKSLAGKIVTLLRHVRTLRKWDGIALITKCSSSTYFRMGTVTPT